MSDFLNNTLYAKNHDKMHKACTLVYFKEHVTHFTFFSDRDPLKECLEKLLILKTLILFCHKPICCLNFVFKSCQFTTSILFKEADIALQVDTRIIDLIHLKISEGVRN